MKLKSVILFLLCYIQSYAQTLRINEFSNGPSGSREWIELVVAPTSPTPNVIRGCFNTSLNVAGWILDDNDGTFSPANNNFGSGFATGHLRFKNVAPWNKLPMGAIIVIYNDLDKDLILPADDPYDIDSDCVYVLPATHSSIEYCTTAPIAQTCSTKLSYASCTLYGAGNWNTINASNSGDGMQIRDDTYNLIHGIVYGRTTASSCGSAASMVGNASSPLVATTNGVNTFYAYNGLDLAGYFDATKWTTGSAASATPGAFNNANNQIWIQDTIRKGCICSSLLDQRFDDKIYGNQIIPGFKYHQFGETIVFYSDVFSDLVVTLLSTDGRLMCTTERRFKDFYSYKIPRGIYMMNINVRYRYSQKQLTIKVANL